MGYIGSTKMQLFLDRNKTLLPRVDIIYLLTRIMVLCCLAWFTFFGNHLQQEHILFYIILGTFLAHLIIFYIAMQGHFDIKLAYFSAIIYDLISIPSLIIFTGHINSPFYPLLYITVSVAAYVLTFWFSLMSVSLVTVVYIVAILSNISFSNSFDIVLKIGFIWVYYLAILYASDYMRRSERRLLKLFNTLNMRTAELEKSQAHLEMIYENTRILASILETDGVVKEIMRILSHILQYQAFCIIFKDKEGNFFYRARFINGKSTYQIKPIYESETDLINKITTMREPIIVKDTKKRNDYNPLTEKSRSVIIVPMVSHGHSNGILIAESDKINDFADKDLQMLSVVARSAALALENAELHKKTEELTIIDELTGAYNYRYFIHKLQEEKRRAMRYSLPLSLIMVDIDWFKRLNDTYGHEIGNIVLKKLSGIIKQCVRDVDIFSRYGGEEFAIILPQTPQKEAAAIGERIREQVEREVFMTEKNAEIKITVSVGISSYPENGKSQEELVTVADQALYQAKGEGRNQVCII